MPYDANGTFSLLPSYRAEPGQPIRVEQHNPVLEDIAAAITASFPRDARVPLAGALNAGGFKITNVSPGTSPTDVATVSQAGVPIGSMFDWPGDTPPTGWLLCYGQAVSRATYADLFTVLGTKFGAGNGSTTFNLPDLRGRIVAGKDDMGGTDATRLSSVFAALARTLGGALGAASHVLTIAQMPKHDHGGNTGAAGAHGHPTQVSAYNQNSAETRATGGMLLHTVNSSAYPANTGAPGEAAGTQIGAAPNHQHTITVQGADQAHPNAQPTLILNKIIRAAY